MKNIFRLALIPYIDYIDDIVGPNSIRAGMDEIGAYRLHEIF